LYGAAIRVASLLRLCTAWRKPSRCPCNRPLLIDLDYDYMLIAKRIGHEDVKYIIETYGHLYPQKHAEVVKKLESLEE